MATKNSYQGKKKDLIDKARSVLNGAAIPPPTLEYLKALCKDLETVEQFSYATDILLTSIENDTKNGIPTSLSTYQKLAKYIYKDQSLSSRFKFNKALIQLTAHGQLYGKDNCETLGLAGAIYKRKWQFDNQFKNLELSNHAYKKGFECWQCYRTDFQKKESDINISLNEDLNDDGYTAINYAYVNELMAIIKLKELGSFKDLLTIPENSLQIGDEVRNYIIKQFIDPATENPPKLKTETYSSWVVATVAEAFFGLRKYKEALAFINKYKFLEAGAKKPGPSNLKNDTDDDVLSWKIKTFSQQMFSIAGLQLELKKYVSNSLVVSDDSKLKNVANEIDKDGIRNCLMALGRKYPNKGPDEQEEEYNDSKCGLALSGGGFRAALFHIGVLAALAEQDKLRNIEVISCVSGGSIIGAFYYLKLKALLESKNDVEIKKENYVKIVQEIEIEFKAGIQKNLRMRIFKNLLKNVKMLSKNYSRSHRLGELYESHLYRKLLNKEKIFMKDLIITPRGSTSDFCIEIENWKRVNKIPQLILNATSVNTGHNWQFTASWMGEPPGNINEQIDVKPCLRRMYYDDAPGKYKEFRLGYAVASSSCVPVMFEPMPLYDLYPGIDLQLIDGGLHDNQGIASLLEQECKHLIISDASGQLPSTSTSQGNEASLFLRADNILQERIREIQFMDLSERFQTSQITSLIKMHLKSGLNKPPVSWKSCVDPPRKLVYEKNSQDTIHTKYNVLRTVEEKLSELRTDLDSFNDVECLALMYSGYMQTNLELDFNGKSAIPWNFLKIEKTMTIPEKSDMILPILETGKNLTFKIINFNKFSRYVAFALGFIALIFVLKWVIENLDVMVICPIYVKTITMVIVIALIGLASKPLAGVLNIKNSLRKYALIAFAIVLGCVICNLYVFLLNCLYNWLGRIKKEFHN